LFLHFSIRFSALKKSGSIEVRSASREIKGAPSFSALKKSGSIEVSGY